MRMLFLILGCSSVTLGDSDVPPCVAACDALYIDCVDMGVVYSSDHADCLEQCKVREEMRPGESVTWGECVLAEATDDVQGCEVAGSDCGVGPCHDPSSDRGDGGCGHY